MGVGQEAQDTAMFRELEERLLQPDVRSSAEEIAKLLGRVHRDWKFGPSIQ